MQSPPKTKSSKAPVLITIGLVSVVAVIFAFAFIIASQANVPETLDTELDETTYMEEATALVEMGDPREGANLIINQLPCGACHITGAGNVAPPFDLIPQHAPLREPLQLEAYIYESIIHPHVFLVPGYPNAMPTDYGTSLTEEQLADIMAYLTQVARSAASS